MASKAIDLPDESLVADAIGKLKAGCFIAVADIHNESRARIFTKRLLESGQAGIFFIEWVKNAKGGSGFVAKGTVDKFGLWLDEATDAMAAADLKSAAVGDHLGKGGYFVDIAYDSDKNVYDPRRFAEQAGNQASPTMIDLVGVAVENKVMVRSADASYWAVADEVKEVNVGLRPGIALRDGVAGINIRNFLRNSKVKARGKKGAVMLWGKEHFETWSDHASLVAQIKPEEFGMPSHLYDLY